MKKVVIVLLRESAYYAIWLNKTGCWVRPNEPRVVSPYDIYLNRPAKRKAYEGAQDEGIVSIVECDESDVKSVINDILGKENTPEPKKVENKPTKEEKDHKEAERLKAEEKKKAREEYKKRKAKLKEEKEAVKQLTLADKRKIQSEKAVSEAKHTAINMPSVEVSDKVEVKGETPKDKGPAVDLATGRLQRPHTPGEEKILKSPEDNTTTVKDANRREMAADNKSLNDKIRPSQIVREKLNHAGVVITASEKAFKVKYNNDVIETITLPKGHKFYRKFRVGDRLQKGAQILVSE